MTWKQRGGFESTSKDIVEVGISEIVLSILTIQNAVNNQLSRKLKDILKQYRNSIECGLEIKSNQKWTDQALQSFQDLINSFSWSWKTRYFGSININLSPELDKSMKQLNWFLHHNMQGYTIHIHIHKSYQ